MGFIGKRLAITILTLFLVSFFTFAAFSLIPGDPALLALGIEASDEQLAALRAEMGLDRGYFEQYFSWFGKFLTGSLGRSSRFRGESISALVAERLPVTFSLALLSFVLILLISVPLALLSVKKENSITDRTLNILTAVTISFPGFFLGILFIWIFGLVLRLFVPGAYVDYRDNFAAFLGYLFFPALTVAVPNAAILVKFLRGSIFRQLKSDYVRTALSKGNTRRGVLREHVLKNAAIPAITTLGMITAEIFSGSIVIEQVFTIPGIGRLLIASITSRDFAMVQTLVVYIAFVVVLANTLADIAIRIVDPRIRFRS
ncbi:MAG: ABC transporter permease [Spirochaetaceae bacterium]|jgi:ABC-type dipeptide/oligopeptide/nickel transport system permease component|nr:ABC transporter permease [Spirochaetaceae bacterium]